MPVRINGPRLLHVHPVSVVTAVAGPSS